MWVNDDGLRAQVITRDGSQAIRVWLWSYVSGEWIEAADVASPTELSRFVDLGSIREVEELGRDKVCCSIADFMQRRCEFTAPSDEFIEVGPVGNSYRYRIAGFISRHPYHNSASAWHDARRQQVVNDDDHTIEPRKE